MWNTSGDALVDGEVGGVSDGCGVDGVECWREWRRTRLTVSGVSVGSSAARFYNHTIISLRVKGRGE